MSSFSLFRRSASNSGDWVVEYAKTAAVQWSGTVATVRNVRNFTYRTRDDYIPAYYDASYDINDLAAVDLVVSRWTGNAIAHVFLTFGFGSGQRLAISIETRRLKGQQYSKFGGFIRNYSLIYVAADERDLIGVRTDIRKESVYLYPLTVPLDIARALLTDYLHRIEHLNLRPEFYHTLCNNCTTNIVRHARSLHPKIGYSWKILLSGYADLYAYELGLLGEDGSFPALKERHLIRRPSNAVIDERFSQVIRHDLAWGMRQST
jgi:hypothetical protein